MTVINVMYNSLQVSPSNATPRGQIQSDMITIQFIRFGLLRTLFHMRLYKKLPLSVHVVPVQIYTTADLPHDIQMWLNYQPASRV